MPNRLLQDSTTDLLYLQGGGGGSYSGISPVVVDNVNGTIGLSQPDLVSSISGDFYSASNPSGFITEDALTGYQPAGDYYSASNPSGFIASGYVSGISASAAAASEVLAASADSWNSSYDTVCANSAAWASGHEYSGIDPIYVDNTNDTISAATWDIQFGSGFSAVDDNVNRTTTVNIDSKEFNVESPLALTETTSSFDLSITGDIGGSRTRIINYGTDRWDDVLSAMDGVSSGKYDYVVMKYTDTSGNEYYAPLDKYTPSASCNFVCPSNEQDTVYGYGQRRKDTIFTINSGDMWVTRNVRPFIGRVIGGTNVTVDVQGEDYLISAAANSEIYTDSTLLGSGTQSDPLGISYPLNPSNNAATATFNQYGMSATDSVGYAAYLGSTGMTVVSGTASASADLQSINNWNSNYDTVYTYSGSWGASTVEHDNNLTGDGTVNHPLGLSSSIAVTGLIPSIYVLGYNDSKSARINDDDVTFWAPGSGGQQQAQYGAGGFDLTYNGGEYYHTELATTARGITIRYLGNTNWSAHYANTGASFTDPTGTEAVGAGSIRTWNSASDWIAGLDVNDIVYTASLPATPDASTLYLIPEA